ncbi:MAG: AbrB/MazE/SpoVT family DNA-binding domain-containing protein [Ilumatobacteraceae bacterium]
MEATVDQRGRILLPRPLRDRLGLVPGATVDLSLYGDGLHLSPGGRKARIEEREGVLVAVAGTAVTDDDVLNLLDSIRQ